MNRQAELDFLREHLPYVRAEHEFHPQPLPDRYHFLNQLGAGATGTVWLAWDSQLERYVAVKVLRAEKYGEEGFDRLEQEGRQVGQMSSERRLARGLVQVYDLIRANGGGYLVMEYVDGGSLGNRIRQFGPLHWSVACRYMANVADVLADMHERGFAHNDIKPDNLLWSMSDDQVLLGDFGFTSRPAVRDSEVVCGTPGYMAPEIQFGQMGAAADNFSTTATAFHLITGEPPFYHSDFMEGLRRAAAGLPDDDPRWRRVPPRIRDVLRQGLSPNRDARPSAKQLAEGFRGAAARTLAESLSTANRASGSGDLRLSAEVLHAGVRVSRPALAGDSTGPILAEAATGGSITVRFHTESGGYLSLLNIGTSGRMIVFPLGTNSPAMFMPAGSKHEFTFALAPPTGSEELVGILTREPADILPDEWFDRVKSGPAALEPEVAYRDLELVASHAVTNPGEWLASVVLIQHS